MTRDRDEKDEIADALADGSKIDWENRLRDVSDEESRRVVEQFQVIEELVPAPESFSRALEKLEDFEIDHEIGRGGMGRVYEARQVSLDRRVALKVLQPEFTGNELRLQRFEREAKALAALNHPNIVTIYSIERTDGAHVLNMELVSGETLDALFARRRPTLHEFLELAIQLADAVSAAHEHGITHRDLKPHNIMVRPDGRVKVLDFGLAKLRTEMSSEEQASSASTLVLTREGSLLGTLPYMSPEQVEGRPVDPRSDIFSLGILLYEFASGVRPFRGETTAALASSILREEPPPVSVVNSSMPPDIDRIITHCLRKKPDDRYQTAKGLRNELRELLTVSVERPHLLVRRQRRVHLWGIAAGALIVLSAVVMWWLTRPRALPEWTPLRLTSEAVRESEPALSPDGRELAFVSDRAGNPDIWLVDSNGGGQLRLTVDPASDRSPTWSPDGSNLFFVSDRTGVDAIWKIDRLGGTPVLLMSGAIDPAISPEGDRVAFAVLDENGYRRIAVAPLEDPSRIDVLTGGDQGLWDHVEPAWSPDGRTICFADFRDLWTVPSSGGEVTRLTDEHETDFDPVYSPLGDYIYFSSMRENTLAVWRIPAAGGEAQRLTQGTGPEVEPSISGDGLRLAHSTAAGPANIWMLDRRSGERWRIPGIRTDDLPAFSPDGDRIVFCSDRRGDFDLWIQRLVDGMPSGVPEQLTDQPGSEPVAVFSPDGRWIAYGRVLEQQRDIWIGDARGGPPRRLTDDPGVDIHPAWSPDGKNLAWVSDRAGTDDLWIVPVRDGGADGQPARVTDGAVTVSFPAWAPGGRELAFIGRTGNEDSVWILDLAGEKSMRRLEAPSAPRFVRWNPTGRTMLVSARDDSHVTRLYEVDPDSGTVAPVEPEVVFGDESATGTFDISTDGEWIAYVQEVRQSELWILHASRGRF